MSGLKREQISSLNPLQKQKTWNSGSLCLWLYTVHTISDSLVKEKYLKNIGNKNNQVWLLSARQSIN